MQGSLERRVVIIACCHKIQWGKEKSENIRPILYGAILYGVMVTGRYQ